MAEAGIPVFTAAPARDQHGEWLPHGGSGKCGYWLPDRWHETVADPAAVDAWQPGMALCAVMGHGIDAIDVDPRNGGDIAALNGALPRVLGAAFTPSGGSHVFVTSLGVHTTHGRGGTVLQGIDIQAGVDGSGHGFVFLAPTRKVSKSSGDVAGYRWAIPIDVDAIGNQDTSGDELRRLVLDTGPRPVDGAVASFMALKPWESFDAGLAFDAGRHNGVIRLVASLHGRGGWQYEDVRRYFDAVVWPEIDQAQGDHEYSYDEFVADIDDEWHRLDAKAEAENVTPSIPDLALPTDAPALRLEASELPDDHMRGEPPPVPPYVLDDLLREGELAALVSEAKAGKSLLALDRVLDACAAGRRIVYLDAENGLHDIHTRRAALGHADIDLSGRLIYNSFPSVVLDVEASARELLLYVAKKRAQYGRIDAVVLDTASRFLSGGENDAEPWLSMYRLALLPLKREGIAVLRLDHLGKDPSKGARGSSAKSGDVDTVWELYSDPPQIDGATRVVLSCSMQRTGTHERAIVFSRSVVGGILGHRRVGDLAGGMVVAAVESLEDRIVRELDRVAAPRDVGRLRAKQLLPEIQARDTVWATALKARKNRLEDPQNPPDNDLDETIMGTGPGTVPMITEQVGTGEGVSAGQTCSETCSQDQEKIEPQESRAPVPLSIEREQASNLSREQVTNRGVSKTEQRKLERQQAVLDAAGPLTELPAVVDRAGTITPTTAASVRECLWAFGSELTVDVESTGYPVGHEHYALRTIQIGDSSSALVLDATDPDQCELARELLAQATVLHAHSATADLVPLALAGLIDYDESWQRMQDTVIPAKLADPSSTGSDPALKQLSDVVLGDEAVSPKANEARANLFKLARWLTDTKSTTPLAKSGWAQVDPRCATMTRYAASDVLDTAELAQRLPKPPPAVWERERLAQRMTARVAYRGYRLEPETVTVLYAEHDALRQAAADRIAAHGVGNPGSDVQVAAKLLEYGAELPATATGRPSVARDAITPLIDAPGPLGGLIRARLEYEHHSKLLDSFLEPYSALVTRGDGRVRPTVYTLGADTGRMSCVRPNLQQVPRTGGIRGCITADPGKMLISADFASVEVRVMAALSQDPNLMYQLAHGLNVHEKIAEQVFGPRWTKADKYVVKRGVFGWAYGGGIPTLAKQVGVSESVMGSVVKVLRELAPAYVEWAQGVKQSVMDGMRQYVTYSGRVIHLDPRFPHKAPNYLIQGTARELLIDALIRWADTPWGTCTLLPVHDEIVVEVPEQDAETATQTLIQCMESELFGVAIQAAASEPAFAWRDST